MHNPEQGNDQRQPLTSFILTLERPQIKSGNQQEIQDDPGQGMNDQVYEVESKNIKASKIIIEGKTEVSYRSV
jgi:hypothetical protein